MPLVKCHTLYNEEKYVEAEKLILRPSVYGIVIHEGKLLVAKGLYTKRYVLPGGAIEKGETNDAALIREVQEETGLDVTVGDFLHFETDFFYYDPLDMAMHGFLFYYHCTPHSTELETPDYPPEEGLEIPLWVDISTLRKEDFQGHGETIMTLLANMSL